jgi:hypothetical protein
MARVAAAAVSPDETDVVDPVDEHQHNDGRLRGMDCTLAALPLKRSNVMQSLKVLIAGAILSSACSPSSTPAPELPPGPEGVTKVVADVRGITCPTCGAVAEVALRQRLPGVVTVSISQSQQTIAVALSNGGGLFSPAVFRDAVAGPGIEVLTFQIDACGVVEETESQHWFVAGENRFALEDSQEVPARALVCISGRLDDQVNPHRLTLTAIHPLPL